MDIVALVVLWHVAAIVTALAVLAITAAIASTRLNRSRHAPATPKTVVIIDSSTHSSLEDER